MSDEFDVVDAESTISRTELLRRAGSHAAKEFMERLEGELVPDSVVEGEQENTKQRDAPESVVPPASLPYGERTGDSSAYIPAVRPIDRSSDDSLEAVPSSQPDEDA